MTPEEDMERTEAMADAIKEDLDVTYYTEEEAFWREIREKAREVAEKIIPEQMKSLEKEKKLNKAIAEMAERELNLRGE